MKLLSLPQAAIAFAILATGCGEEDHSHGSTGDILVHLEHADAANGAEHFAMSCASAACHGAQGSGGPAPDLAVQVPLHDNPALAGLLTNGQGKMPGLSDSFTDFELAEVILYVRETFPE